MRKKETIYIPQVLYSINRQAEEAFRNKEISLRLEWQEIIEKGRTCSRLANYVSPGNDRLELLKNIRDAIKSGIGRFHIKRRQMENLVGVNRDQFTSCLYENALLATSADIIDARNTALSSTEAGPLVNSGSTSGYLLAAAEALDIALENAPNRIGIKRLSDKFGYTAKDLREVAEEKWPGPDFKVSDFCRKTVEEIKNPNTDISRYKLEPLTLTN